MNMICNRISKNATGGRKEKDIRRKKKEDDDNRTRIKKTKATE